MPTLLDAALVTDTLLSLPGWQGDQTGIWRDLHLTPEVDAELRRQIEVDAAAMGHTPEVATIDGATRFTLRTAEEGGVTELDITFASHISDLVHRLASDEPGINAIRHGDPVVTVRPADTADQGPDVESPTIGIGSVTGGTSPATPLPDQSPGAPEPGVSTEQTRP